MVAVPPAILACHVNRLRWSSPEDFAERECAMRSCLSPALATLFLFLFLFPEDALAQTENQPEQSEQEFGPRQGSHFSVASLRTNRDLGLIKSIPLHPLFSVELKTDISLEGRCYYYLADPCSVLQVHILNFARNELLQASVDLLTSMLDDRGFEETLRQSITYELRKGLLELRRNNRDGQATPITTNRLPAPTESPCPCPEPFPRPDTRRLLTGTLLFAGGGLLSASKNDWIIDEGFIGVGIATYGLGMVLKQLVPEWRGGRIAWFGTNMSIAW